jgi:hypothetical protein
MHQRALGQQAECLSLGVNQAPIAKCWPWPEPWPTPPIIPTFWKYAECPSRKLMRWHMVLKSSPNVAVSKFGNHHTFPLNPEVTMCTW